MQPLRMRAQSLCGRGIPMCCRIRARLIKRSLTVLALFLGSTLFPGCVLFQGGGASAQAQSDYTRGNSWTVFGEYAPNSSHIFWGVSRKRVRLEFGSEYGRRLVRGHGLEFDCFFQARPVGLEKDPTLVGFRNVGTGQILRFPQPTRVVIVDTSTFSVPNIGQFVPVYGSEWTYGFGIDPIGLKLNFHARSRLQPFADATGGLIVTSRDIPIDNASSFNYEFGFGGGLDYFLSARRSLRFGYAFRHISNNGISAVNPGIDAGVIEIGYSFGR